MFTKYTRGMVYWANIPRYEQNANIQSGRRPVIIVSNNVANCLSNNVTIVPCTTNTEKRPDQPTHHIMSLNPREESMVLAEDIITINKNLLENFMGILDETIMKEIDKCIMAALGLIDIPNPLLGDCMARKNKEEVHKEEVHKEKQKINKSRRVIGTSEQLKFINYYEQHGMEETMAEYGVPTKSAVYQRIQWYKQKLNKK